MICQANVISVTLVLLLLIGLWGVMDVKGQSEPKDCSNYGKEDQRKILLLLLNSTKYDKRVRPGAGRDPVFVNMTLHIVNMGPISEYEMNFVLTIYLRQYWFDRRLVYKGCRPMVLSNDVANSLWMPDSFFHSETYSYIHDVTSKNIFFRLHPDGKILMSFRATVTNSCEMKLKDYPMDMQTCELRVASYGYTAVDMRYGWADIARPITMSDNVKLANFEILNYTWTAFSRNLSTGEWATLKAEFQFGRNTLYFIIQMYVPSTLIVILSWVSFWVGQSSIPARAALGITAVLTILTLIDSTNSNMPKISYMKAIDLYYAGCFVFVFASLIEFAAVCYLEQEMKKRVKSLERRRAAIDAGDPRHGKDNQPPSWRRNIWMQDEESPWSRVKSLIFGNRRNNQRGWARQKVDFDVNKIDQFSRFFFPISFFTLVTVYWILYWPRGYHNKEHEGGG